MRDVERFWRARDILLAEAEDYEAARRRFEWPRLERFNWALDHFDAIPTREREALVVIGDDDSRTSRTFDELTQRSNRLAQAFHEAGVARGDRVLLMLPNVVELWETMLACMKLGAVIVPATTQLTRTDIEDRVKRGRIRHVVTDEHGAGKLEGIEDIIGRFLVGARQRGWSSLLDVSGEARPEFMAGLANATSASDPLLVYFTSGTTAKPKLVVHTHTSYPVGHLSTMYWIGVAPSDVHWNISSPGWAKHAWSNVFAPWNAGATVLVHATARFSAERTLALLEREQVTTLCAPPTVFRMLILEDLTLYEPKLRRIAAAGEPLNPEIIAKVEHAWGITVRDGFGQTETTALVGNSPGQAVVPGSMGRPLPGYRVVLEGPDGELGDEGEICLELDPRPAGLMVGYEDDPELTATVIRGGRYHTGDVAQRDRTGRITYVGRADDVFKASDYRISPFELESVLIEHPAVAEAAVVPSPDPIRLAVPKGFVSLAPGFSPSAELAKEIFAFVREKVPPYKRIRRLEFVTADTSDDRVVMPKTISGKIRRVELRTLEATRADVRERRPHEHFEHEP